MHIHALIAPERLRTQNRGSVRRLLFSDYQNREQRESMAGLREQEKPQGRHKGGSQERPEESRQEEIRQKDQERYYCFLTSFDFVLSSSLLQRLHLVALIGFRAEHFMHIFLISTLASASTNLAMLSACPNRYLRILDILSTRPKPNYITYNKYVFKDQ